MKSLVVLSSLIFLTSCASTGGGQKTKGKLLTEARYESLGDKKPRVQCDSESSKDLSALVEQSSNCARLGAWDKVENHGKNLAARAHESGWGPYFLSLSAENRGQQDRALWMVELALKKEPGRAVFYYQKARLLGKMGDEEGQQKALELGYSQEPNTEPFLLLSAKKSYNQGDCSSVKKLSTKANLSGVGTAVVLIAECHALDGELVEARAILDSFLKHSPTNAEVLLQRARVEETFAANFPEAASLYRRIEKSAQQPELLAWVKSKLQYLEGSSGTIRVSKKGER